MERGELTPNNGQAQLVWNDDHPGVSAYLDRCQVFTPEEWVQRLWKLIQARRASTGKVVEFGAGDGRFSHAGAFRTYVGYEVDAKLVRRAKLPKNAKLLQECAFSSNVKDADVCIGNPPYVRNQDLPEGWRETVASKLALRTGVNFRLGQRVAVLHVPRARQHQVGTGLVAQIAPYAMGHRPTAT